MEQEIFVSKLNTPCIDGLRVGRLLSPALNIWGFWNLASSQGEILIVGELEKRTNENESLFRPIKTWVPDAYDLWECPNQCYVSKEYVPADSVTEPESCLRCGELTQITFKLRPKGTKS